MPRNSQQLGLVDGRRFEDWAPWEGQGVPLRENCDLANPRQRFLWMFTALPGLKGAPLLMPPEYFEMVSWRICVLGGDIVGEPGLKYQPPATMSNPWSASGKWVDLDTPDPERPTLDHIVDGLSQADRTELGQIMLGRLGVDPRTPTEPPPGQYRVSELARRLEVDAAEVVRILDAFGLRVQPDSLVDREVADRIAVHLGV